MSKGMSHLNWQNRHELLNILAEEISQYTLHPDIKQHKQVAAQLIKMYPALKSSIGDGLNVWAERIYAKMKDYRLKLGTPESKAVRKKKEKKDASESIKVPHHGETNFLPSSVIPSDDENSMISWMKEEAKKPNSDQDKKKNRAIFAYNLSSSAAKFNKRYYATKGNQGKISAVIYSG